MNGSRFPTRFHIGTQRAGSSYLYNLLRQHPEVSLSPLQEIHYFSRRTEKGDSWYLSNFKPNGVPIDTSPDYFGKGSDVASGIAEKIRRDSARFTLILRNPPDYAYSFFRMWDRAGFFKVRGQVVSSLIPYLEEHPTFANIGSYSIRLDEWYRYFSPSQFKIIIFERFVKTPQLLMREVFDFFGLDPVPVEALNSSRNTALRWPLMYSLKRAVVKQRRVAKLLKTSKTFEWAYDRLLTDRDRLSGDDRAAIVDKTKEDVDRLREILKDPIPEWTDYPQSG